MASSIEDIEYLARSEHRIAALRSLSGGPCDRDELQQDSGASKATIARLLNEFEGRKWVVREGHQYELTDLGIFVADEFLQLVDRMETERSLRDVWQWFPSALDGCTVSMFADAMISLPKSHSPYHPIPRFVELVESAHQMRGFSDRSLKPGSYEVVLQHAIDGMETELIFPSAVIDEMVTVTVDGLIEAAIESRHLSLLEHETLPSDLGLALFDDRLALYCRDENGITRVGIDTDTRDAVSWGESVYEDVRDEAQTIEAAGRFG